MRSPSSSPSSVATPDEVRFGFGRNWSNFVSLVDDQRLGEAKRSLQHMLELTSLSGKRFLDIGCGSGLFSLAARQLGAEVHSFDFDSLSVRTAQQLKNRYLAEDSSWRIEQGSALDQAYLQSLGSFDIVYAWGVLHHTGSMWAALENALIPLAGGGSLFLSIYNDQGWLSGYWKEVKRLYNRNAILRGFIVVSHLPYLFVRVAVRLVRGRGNLRGMSLWYDLIDWLGGYPFEVARPDQIVEFFSQRGVKLVRLKSCGRRHGCNEYIFTRSD